MFVKFSQFANDHDPMLVTLYPFNVDGIVSSVAFPV